MPPPGQELEAGAAGREKEREDRGVKELERGDETGREKNRRWEYTEKQEDAVRGVEIQSRGEVRELYREGRGDSEKRTDGGTGREEGRRRWTEKGG